MDDVNIPGFGLFFEDVDSAKFYHITVMCSEDNGISLYSSVNVTIEYATVTNVGRGIVLWNNSNMHISDTTFNVSRSGIDSYGDEYISITNITIFFTHFPDLAIDMSRSQNIRIENISFLPILQFGSFELKAAVRLLSCYKVAIFKSIFANLVLHSICILSQSNLLCS